MLSLRILGTQIRVKANFAPVLVAVWAVVVLLGQRAHPKRWLGKGMLVAVPSALLLVLAEFGHAFAHIFSARLAGGPMDVVLISAETGMPRTLYWNNDVSPETHRLRAIGGPLYNALGLLLSATGYRLLACDSTGRELAGWSALGHGFLFVASLAPVPVVDGGSILKWTLVSRGRTPAEADRVVRRTDWALASAAATTGAGLIVGQKWVPGLVLIGVASAVAAAGEGKLR